MTFHISICKGSYYEVVQLNNKQDFDRAERLCKDSTNMAGFFKQVVLPIRTNQASDLFCPALKNMAMIIEHCAEDYFAMLGAMVLDLTTLPIRLVTFLPRMIHNILANPVEHPLIPYLRSKGLLFVDGKVTVHLYTKNIVGNQVNRSGNTYSLYLTDNEIAFSMSKCSSFALSRPLSTPPCPRRLVERMKLGEECEL